MRLLFFTFLGLLLFSCAKEHVPAVARGEHEALETTELAREENTLAILPKGRASIPACEVLSRLSEKSSDGPEFQYFAALDGRDWLAKDSWWGGVEITRSPFTQIFLGETFAAGTEEEFFTKAEQEHEAGKIGGLKWLVVRTMKKLGWLSVLQFSTINERLDEAFPGIHGWRRDVRGSLAWNIASRAAALSSISNKEVSRILTTKLPIFPAGGWEEFSRGTRENLGAGVTGLLQTDNPQENLCGFVLLQHHFAQLLRIKGYRAPVVIPPLAAQPQSSVRTLSRKEPTFKTYEIAGAFTEAGKPTVLESESITSYDPRHERLGVTRTTPGGLGAESEGSLKDALAMMEGLIHSFEATSPASPWVKERGAYWFGDVQGGGALLPAEAHSLSLGLLTLHFKNLAARHIRQVNAAGKSLGAGETAAGFVLDGPGLSRGAVSMDVKDLARLTRVVLQLDGSLHAFFDEKEEHWHGVNPVYDHKLLMALLGPEYFGEQGPAAAGAPEALRTSIRSLRLPLAVLFIEMGAGKAGCVSSVQWNLANGERRPVKACDRGERALIVDSLRLLGRRSGASLLTERADEIEAAGR